MLPQCGEPKGQPHLAQLSITHGSDFNSAFLLESHQQKCHTLLSANLFSMISPAKYGRLGAFHFCEVTAQLMKVDFWALSSLICAFGTLKVIEVFPDGVLSLDTLKSNAIASDQNLICSGWGLGGELIWGQVCVCCLEA